MQIRPIKTPADYEAERPHVMGATYIKFVGTHEEYDSINVATVEPER